MKIVEKFKAKAQNNFDREGVTIAFLGDSVTQGCFEVYKKRNGEVETVFDKNAAYHNYLAQLLATVFPSVPVSIINAGISGDNSAHGFERLERDVLRHNPDLVVVCYGLNDCCQGEAGLAGYASSLSKIFKALNDFGCEAIFMTPNMMNTSISPFIVEDEVIINIAKNCMELQNGGIMDMYMQAARQAAAEQGIALCDCYAKWKRLYECGADVTEFLSNKINHPTREMNRLFAVSLLETILN